MADKYLNESGLQRFWNGIKAKFAPLVSPALTGTPTAPTASSGTNTTQIATTAFVTAAIPGSLKNPNKLTIVLNGTTYEYDGSSAVTITINSGDGVSY